MNLQAVSSAVHTALVSATQKAAPVALGSSSTTAAPARTTDTVSLSPAAQGAKPSIDVDHDGDSR